MIIVFWSPVPDIPAGDNMLCIGMMAAIKYGKKVCLIHKDQVAPVRRTKEIHLMSIWKDRIYYPGIAEEFEEKMTDRERNRRWIHQDSCVPYLKQIEKKVDLVFLDAGPVKDNKLKRIFQAADVITVNLWQNYNALDRFFKCRQIYSHKYLYVWDRYDEDSTCNASYIHNIYRVSREHFGVILYNPEFEKAVSELNVLGFLLNNHDGGQTCRNELFMLEVLKTTQMVLRKAGMIE
ncbi:hypothetical protein [Diplocloster agilis]|uniref:hypothetical protein n=1 Tax=Diplocloster agilis TaxID=2850323 RepID=UPI000820F703|nr:MULTISPECIES: hypothetical protein [Lachnospiraceae]MBU9743120.1 hypothetical protein [Diplocloster agilis]MCU6736307.1 hypothetical protein [Suonthocola fibrivorans]SCJ89045.1 Uncharacterised protein [uncultured Clostridium sp.]